MSALTANRQPLSPLQRLLVGLLFAWAHVAAAAYPSRPIKVIVPTDAGGSVDNIARTIGRAIEKNKALPVKLIVVNQPGAGGTIGTRRIKNAKADGYTIGLWHQGLVTSKAMGVVDYDHTAFELIGSTGYSEIGIGAGSDSQVQNFSDLLIQSKVKPLKFATNIGLPVHIVPMIFAEEIGISFQFIQVGGGSQRLSSVIGGHTDLGIFSTLDFGLFKDAGIRPIVFFSENRKTDFPEVPTTREIGIEFDYQTHYLWIAPKNVPKTAIRALEKALRSVTSDPDVVEHFNRLGLVSSFQQGSEIEGALNNIREQSFPVIEKMRGK